MVAKQEGQPLFQDVHVYGCKVDNGSGGTQPAWVAYGLYCSGLADPKDGMLHWRPTFFVADVPYKPSGKWGGVDRSTAQNCAAQFQKFQSPTLLDFMTIMGDQAGGTSFSNEWWDTHCMAISIIGSFLLIGVLWPLVVDRVEFGQWIRPPREKGIDLSDVRSSPAAAKPQLTAQDLKQVAAMGDQLEAELAASATDSRTKTVAPAINQPVPQLSATQLDSSKPAEAKPPKSYQAGDRDFYPTERRDPKAGHAEKRKA